MDVSACVGTALSNGGPVGMSSTTSPDSSSLTITRSSIGIYHGRNGLLCYNDISWRNGCIFTYRWRSHQVGRTLC